MLIVFRHGSSIRFTGGNICCLLGVVFVFFLLVFGLFNMSVLLQVQVIWVSEVFAKHEILGIETC